MENKKIVVTVEDGTDISVYDGNFIHVNVFSSIADGMQMQGESRGSDFIPRSVVDGATDSILQLMAKISRSPEMERRLLTVAARKLIKRAEELDSKPEPEPIASGTTIGREEARQVLKGILAAMRED